MEEILRQLTLLILLNVKFSSLVCISTMKTQIVRQNEMKNLECVEEKYSKKYYGGAEDYAEKRNRDQSKKSGHGWHWIKQESTQT